MRRSETPCDRLCSGRSRPAARSRAEPEADPASARRPTSVEVVRASGRPSAGRRASRARSRRSRRRRSTPRSPATSRAGAWTSATTVKKGQVLAELSVPELEAEAQAEAGRRSSRRGQAEAGRGGGRRWPRPTSPSAEAKLAEVRAGIKRAEADLARWQSEYARVEQLFRERAQTGSLLDETRSKLRSSEATREEVKPRSRRPRSRSPRPRPTRQGPLRRRRRVGRDRGRPRKTPDAPRRSGLRQDRGPLRRRRHPPERRHRPPDPARRRRATRSSSWPGPTSSPSRSTSPRPSPPRSTPATAPWCGSRRMPGQTFEGKVPGPPGRSTPRPGRSASRSTSPTPADASARASTPMRPSSPRSIQRADHAGDGRHHRKGKSVLRG